MDNLRLSDFCDKGIGEDLILVFRLIEYFYPPITLKQWAPDELPDVPLYRERETRNIYIARSMLSGIPIPDDHVVRSAGIVRFASDWS
jgi:hypothetical protein